MSRVLPPEFSRRILTASVFGLASVASSLYNDLPDCAVCASLVVFTSLNYWRNPVYGLRRHMDMAACAGALTYQLSVAAKQADTAPRAAYLLAVAAGGSCYVFARRADLVLKNKDLASRWHVALHLCGNLSNLMLYDSLGVNYCQWERVYS